MLIVIKIIINSCWPCEGKLSMVYAHLKSISFVECIKVEASLGQVYPIFSIKIYIANLHIFPITFGFRFAELNTIVLFQMTQQLYNTLKLGVQWLVFWSIKIRQIWLWLWLQVPAWFCQKMHYFFLVFIFSSLSYHVWPFLNFE